MPEITTMFSRGTPSSGMKPWTAARIAQSPQPGHQRTSWSVLKSFAVSLSSVMADNPLQHFGEFVGLERQPAHLRHRDRVDEVAGPDQGGELAEVHLRDD